MRIILILILSSLLFLSASLNCSAVDVVVIANMSVSANEIDSKTIQRIFYGKKSRWADDTKIVPVMLQSGETHTEFVENILKKSVTKFITYWKQALFTGKGIPPKSFDEESDLVRYVSETPGAIGFVSSSADLKDVKQISVR